NPFLLWLASVKCAPYSRHDLAQAQKGSKAVVESLRSKNGTSPWIPPLHQIEKWWEPAVLEKLGKSIAVITQQENILSSSAVALLKVAFCRTMIDLANVSFGHQSMSFRKP